MTEYLLQTNKMLSISEKQEMFGVKNRMKMIPANFPKPNIVTECLCEMKEDMEHIYTCVLLNNGKQKYEIIHSGTLLNKLKYLEYLKEILKEGLF